MTGRNGAGSEPWLWHRKAGHATILQLPSMLLKPLLVSGWPLHVPEEEKPCAPNSLRDGLARFLQSNGIASLTCSGMVRPKHSGRGDLWTCERIVGMLAEEFGVSYSKSQVSRLLKHLGWTPQVPIPRALQRDEEAIAHWRVHTWPILKEKARRERRTLVFVDKSGLYLLPSVVKTYAPRGQKPVLDEWQMAAQPGLPIHIEALPSYAPASAPAADRTTMPFFVVVGTLTADAPSWMERQPHVSSS